MRAQVRFPQFKAALERHQDIENKLLGRGDIPRTALQMFAKGALAALKAHSNSGQQINKYIRPVGTPGGMKVSLLNLAAGVKTALAGQKIHYIGVTGPLNLDKNGDPTGGTYDVVTYVNGTEKILSQKFVSK